MNLMNRLSMRKKLLLAPLVAASLMVASSIAAYTGIRQQQASLDSIYQERMPATRLVFETDRAISSLQAGTYELLSMMEANYPADKIEAAAKKLQTDGEAISAYLRKALTDTKFVAEERKELEEVAVLVGEYRSDIQQVIDVASVQVSMGTAFMSKAQAKYDELSARMQGLHSLEAAAAEDAYHVAENVARQSQNVVFLALILSVILSVAVALYAGSGVVRSIKAIHRATDKLSQGNLRERIEISGKDEIAQTAEKLNGFIASVHHLVSQVGRSAKEMAGAAGDLSQASSRIADSSAKQSDAASSAATAIQQMTAAVQTIAENAELLRNTSQTSLANTERGGVSVCKLGGEIGTVGGAFNDINSSVGQFVESAKSIAEMTQEVRGLSDQTNLLALNAAIEAARAGDQGRGFAVVADEVRELATRSAKATGAIEELTADIGARSEEVENSLQNGTRSLASCREHATELDEIFGEARASVEEATNGVEIIANGVTEQSSGSAEMAKNIEQIANMAEQNSAVCARTLDAVKGLTALAQSLESAVSRFST